MSLRLGDREREFKLRWRGALLVTLRVLMGGCMALLLFSMMRWPFEAAGPSVERCFRLPEEMAAAGGAGPNAAAGAAAIRECVRTQVDTQVAEAERARSNVAALVILLVCTVSAVFLVRKGLRAQLEDQLQFSEQLIDAIPLPISLRSPEGKFLRVNKAYEQRYGIRQEHLAGQTATPVYPRLAAQIARLDEKALASHHAVEQEFHVGLGADGERSVLVRLQALRQVDKSVLGIVGVHTDITSLRAKEAELTESNEKLKRLSMQMLVAQEEERRRIARDLHDQVGQILTALKLNLGSLGKRASIDKPMEAIVMPMELAEEALRHTRDLSASLHPHLLDDLGLEPALNWLIDRFVRPSVAGVELRCRLNPPRGPDAIELVAFRVVQEALTNAVRHAHATRIGVILEAAQGRLFIEVIDDGVGFEGGNAGVEAKRAASLGLSSMNDRVSEFGGSLELESTLGMGTSLRAQLPWKGERGW